MSTSGMEKFLMYSNIFLGLFGLACNLVSLAYFIRRRGELGNAFLAYLNIADTIVSFSAMAFYSSIIAGKNQHLGNKGLKVESMAIALAFHVVRSSVWVTGVITVYLNVLRTSAIICPLVRFNRQILHASLVALISIIIVFEIILGTVYSYPTLEYSIQISSGIDATAPYLQDHPIHFVVHEGFVIYGLLITVLVMVCCAVSTAKLIIFRDSPQPTSERSTRSRAAAVTVLILSVQYAVLNASALILSALQSHHERKDQDGHGASLMQIGDSILWELSFMALLLNSIFNPIVYFVRVEKLREHLINMTQRISAIGR